MKLVVLDMDDTLFLERSYVRSGFEAVGRALEDDYGISDFGNIAWELFLSGRRGDVFDVALSKVRTQVSHDMIKRCIQSYRRHVPQIQLLPDAVELLDRLSGRVATGLVTDGPKASQWAKVRALGIDRILDRVIVTDDFGPGWAKPSPLAFEKLQAEGRFVGSECIYIADNPAKDFISPKNLGWATVRVRRNGSLHEAIESGPDVDLEVSDLDAERGSEFHKVLFRGGMPNS